MSPRPRHRRRPRGRLPPAPRHPRGRAPHQPPAARRPRVAPAPHRLHPAPHRRPGRSCDRRTVGDHDDAVRRDLVEELGELQAVLRTAALAPDQHRMLRRPERRRTIDRVRGERLIVLDDDRVRPGRRCAPQIGRHRQNARRSRRPLALRSARRPGRRRGPRQGQGAAATPSPLMCLTAMLLSPRSMVESFPTSGPSPRRPRCAPSRRATVRRRRTMSGRCAVRSWRSPMSSRRLYSSRWLASTTSFQSPWRTACCVRFEFGRRPPEERPLLFRRAALEDRQEVDPLVARRHVNSCGREDRCAPVERDRGLIRHAAGANAAGPLDDRRHADAAFPDRPLPVEQRPAVRQPLAAVVVREDDDRVVGQPESRDGLQNPADAAVHGFEHRRVVGSRRRILGVGRHVRAAAGRRRRPVGPVVRPVRGVVGDVEKERLARPRRSVRRTGSSAR